MAPVPIEIEHYWGSHFISQPQADRKWLILASFDLRPKSLLPAGHCRASLLAAEGGNREGIREYTEYIQRTRGLQPAIIRSHCPVSSCVVLYIVVVLRPHSIHSPLLTAVFLPRFDPCQARGSTRTHARLPTRITKLLDH